MVTQQAVLLVVTEPCNSLSLQFVIVVQQADFGQTTRAVSLSSSEDGAEVSLATLSIVTNDEAVAAAAAKSLVMMAGGREELSVVDNVEAAGGCRCRKELSSSPLTGPL